MLWDEPKIFFLERRYFFSIILSEFLKNRVALHWAEMYDHCTFEAKKMIVAKFVKAVRVRRDYEIDIEFNVSFEEFQALYLEGEPEEAKRPGTNTILAMETKK